MLVNSGGGATNGAGYTCRLILSALSPLTPAENYEVNDFRKEEDDDGGLFWA